jgi:tRNA modification GTPase
VPFSPTDTIVALATAPVRAGIGVVRISGPDALDVARGILTIHRAPEPRLATLTHVRAAQPGASRARIPNPACLAEAGHWAVRRRRESRFPTLADGRPIDEVVATFFPGPHSYTAEDVVEISAHGSMALLGEIVRAAIGAGARLAEPGEFTLRAFLNGRLDLVQAEAVADLVDAVTPLQARIAFDQLEGTLTRAIGALDRELFDLAASLEASVDFPDEGYHFIEAGDAGAALGRVRDGIDRLLATSAAGRVIREGRHVAILGKPNVGKSSLFNQLVGTDRAIVAAGPGTTRDMLRETVDLGGIRLGLVDTAGIRASGDEVEREGVMRARGAAGVADLVVLMLDQSRPLEDIDRALLLETASAPRVVVVNKIDLPPTWTARELAAGSRDSGRQKQESRSENPEPRIPSPEHATVSLSLKTGAGLDDLRAAMHAALDVAEPLRDAPMISNVRHDTLLRQAREAIARAMANLEEAGESVSEELVLADLAEARGALEEVTGKRTTEDVLRRIFEKFCVGK